MDKHEENELRKQTIRIIDELYPADSGIPEIAEKGQELLHQAEREINNWRNKPTKVLIRYAQLCEDYNREIERWMSGEGYSREKNDEK